MPSRLQQAPHLGRAAAVLHTLAIATLLQPEPVHALLLLSGATLLMLVWPLRPAETINTRTAPDTPSQHGAVATADAAPIAVLPVGQATRARLANDSRFDDVLAHLSHELRTPLNAVIGFADLMDAETFGPVGHPRYREYLGHIRSSGAHLLQSAETTLAIAELLAGGRAAPQKSIVRLDDAARAAMAAIGASSAPIGALHGLEVVANRDILVRAFASLFAEAGAGAPDIGCGIDAEALEDIVIVTIEAADGRPERDSRSSLRIAAARLLLQSINASMSDGRSRDGQRRTWEIAIERAVQPDMFGWRPTADLQPA